MLIPTVISFFVSLLMALLLIHYIHLHQHISGDSAESGPQKYHLGLTPRIGGVPIFLGWFVGLVVGWLGGIITFQGLSEWLLAIAPVFFLGVLEDVTKRVAPLYRLLASFVSAGIAISLLKVTISRVDLFYLDKILHMFPLLSILFTIVAVGGLCHSFNLIDGYNGLAGGVACIILSALAYVCFMVGDFELLFFCLVSIAAIAGFLTWNYPKGLIFAGDGGAYFLGFIIAEISVLLVARNQQVSPWFPLTLSMYPVWETIFTIYRRKFIQGQAAALPDALHLHQMVFNRLVRWMVGKREPKYLRRRNSLTAPYLWGVGFMTVLPAVLLWKHTYALQFVCGLFIVAYTWLYRRLVHFKAPKWLMTHK